MPPSLDAARRAAALVREHLALSDAELGVLAEYVRPYRAAAGADIFAAGAVCREVLLLTRGLVRVYYHHEHREVNLRLLCAPAVVVELASLIRRAPSDETVQCLDDVEGVMLRLEDHRAAHPGETAERLGRVLAEQHYLAMERRLRNLQWKTASERWRYFAEHMEADIVAGVPGFHVASYLGISAESLSRVRSAEFRARRAKARS
jgi:CRP/FNR family transcriptional regulator, anaerobic regulatory protein